jgi:hypothetical protein
VIDPEEYRKRAQDCMSLLSRMDETTQGILLSIAEAWMVRAQAAEERDRRSVQADASPL